MSHIFDALQRSTAERFGIEIPSSLVVTELLESAESKLRAEHATSSVESPAQSETQMERESVAEAGVSTAVEPSATLRVSDELPTRVINVNQFTQFEALKVLVSPQSRLVCLTDKESLAAEKFSFLGVSLRRLQQTNGLKKVLITSTVPQEGKSVVAANIACMLAQRSQQKTLLLEGDLRRPSLAKLFGLGKIPGICEWLQGASSSMTGIYYLENAGFWIMPAGSAPRNALELMQSSRLSGLVDQLTAWFDWIVIDSSPVLPLADASIWMRLADGILLVTRQGTTQKEKLQQTLETIERTKLLGALLNCSVSSADSDYHHYSSQAVSQPSDQPSK